MIIYPLYEHEVLTSSQHSEHGDVCCACGGAGLLLCCDGCERVFHMNCIDPPMEQDAMLDEPWYCYICESNRNEVKKLPSGIFSELLHRLNKKNPVSFTLPPMIRDYFEGVGTGPDGEYMEAAPQKQG